MKDLETGAKIKNTFTYALWKGLFNSIETTAGLVIIYYGGGDLSFETFVQSPTGSTNPQNPVHPLGPGGGGNQNTGIYPGNLGGEQTPRRSLKEFMRDYWVKYEYNLTYQHMRDIGY